MRAERKWRTVHVTPMPEPAEPPRAGDLRCFITWDTQTRAVRRRLRRQSLPYEWAIISVSKDGSYEVDTSTLTP
jgi:hypothetical protein